MITQTSWRPNSLLRKFVLGAHPIIEHYLQKLRIGELIATYMRAIAIIDGTACEASGYFGSTL